MGFAVRLVRAGVGVLMLLLAAPLMIAGGALRLVGDHRAPDGTFTAPIEHLRVDGRAIVVTDIDALLRSGAPFARGGRTTLSISGRGPGGPLFLGLAPYDDVERYLAGVAQTRVTRVRLALGPLAVDTTAIRGDLPPKDPAAQPFWLGTSSGLIRDGRVEAALSWSPSAVRGRHLALVVMNADGSARVDAHLLARLRPAWLGPTSTGLLILGTALVLLALLVLAWPPARRIPVTLPAAPEPQAAEPQAAEPRAAEPRAAESQAAVEIAAVERPPAAEPAVESPLPPLPAVTLRFMWPPGGDRAAQVRAEKADAGVS